jgi:tetratricopeptide (TPR) repeat protein
MSPRPAIFISAVSSELRSARQLVVNTLTFLGYDPEWQELFGTEEGDLRAMLSRRIDACKGMVQLVGKCYGAEPPNIDEQFGRVSYTQYEALYAGTKGKRVWYLFLDDTFPTDPHEAEDEEKRKLQSNYRAKVKADSHLYHPLSSREGLEASVLKLRDELTRLRRGVRRWATFVAVLLVLSVGLSVWLLESQRGSNKHLQAVEEKLEKLQQGVNSFVEVQNKVRQEQPGQKPDEVEERTYQELGKLLGIDAKTLKERLPRFAEELKKSPNATTIERANAAYVAKDYNEAEQLALAAAHEAYLASAAKNAEAIKALELAAWAAEKRVQYADALKRLHEAELLTDRNRDGVEWARLQFAIAWVLRDQGQYRDAEDVLREVLRERECALGSEHVDTLATRHTLATVICDQGKYSEAEAEFDAVLKLERKVLGPEDPATLATLQDLAGIRYDRGYYAEAEREFREVLKLTEKVLGPEHLHALKTRYNVAIALFNQAKLSEAETELCALIKLSERVLGSEHPDTLSARCVLAMVRAKQGKYLQAETEVRAVLELQEKVLGPEHSDTLQTRESLAVVLDYEGKYAEAETEDRAVLELQEKLFAPENSDTLETRDCLARVLAHEGKYAEAEMDYRALLTLKEKFLGLEHSDTLRTCFELAVCLRSESKLQDASAFAQRATDGALKVLGPDHPDTKKYEQLRQELLAKNS